MKIILASRSPRRKELLKLVVPEFEIMVSKADEKIEKGVTPEEQATKLAYIKAKTIYDKTQGERIIIGSDTIVVKNDKIYGKPKNKETARKMIKELLEGDKTHEVITGLSVIIDKQGKCEEHKLFDKAKIYLKDISDEELEKWLNTGKATDRAGGYGIQDEFSVFIEKIEGNYTTVVGLPIHKVYEIINKQYR